MKQPTKADFDVEVDDAKVRGCFKPTESYYDYRILDDGGLSRAAIIRHAKTGDAGDYLESEVESMAYEVARAKLRDRRSP